MGKFLPDSLSLMHVVLAGAAEIRERIPSGFLHSVPSLGAPWPLSTGHSRLRPLQEACYSPKWHQGCLMVGRLLHEDGFPEQALTRASGFLMTLLNSQSTFLPVLLHTVRRLAQIQRAAESKNLCHLKSATESVESFLHFILNTTGGHQRLLNMEIAGFWF